VPCIHHRERKTPPKIKSQETGMRALRKIWWIVFALDGEKARALEATI
jgi:hypothetical protein